MIDTMIVLGAIIDKSNGSDARVLRLVETGVVRLASGDAWLRELSDTLSRPEITSRAAPNHQVSSSEDRVADPGGDPQPIAVNVV